MLSIAENRKEEAQIRFNKTYITSAEIIKRLNVNRSSILYARRNGKLPNAIEVQPGFFYIWEREFIEPYIKAWEITLEARRGG